MNDGSSPSEIKQAKNRILASIAAGQYTSESIRDVVFIGEHSDKSPSIQIQQNESAHTVWIPVVISLFIAIAIVSMGLYIVIKRRRSRRIQEQSDEQDCSAKIVIDCTARTSEYRVPTSAGELEDNDGDEEDQDSLCSSASRTSEQSSNVRLEDSINNDVASDDGSISLEGYDGHDEGSASP